MEGQEKKREQGAHVRAGRARVPAGRQQGPAQASSEVDACVAGSSVRRWGDTRFEEHGGRGRSALFSRSNERGKGRGRRVGTRRGGSSRKGHRRTAPEGERAKGNGNNNNSPVPFHSPLFSHPLSPLCAPLRRWRVLSYLRPIAPGCGRVLSPGEEALAADRRRRRERAVMEEREITRTTLFLFLSLSLYFTPSLSLSLSLAIGERGGRRGQRARSRETTLTASVSVRRTEVK